jgi:hypothetical protein
VGRLSVARSGRGDTQNGPSDIGRARRSGPTAGRYVVIGWKDTREARHAVRDALLQRATRVSVVEACGTSDEKTALGRLDDVARYLTHHRVEDRPKVMLEQEGSGVGGSAGHGRLWTLPPWRVDLRRHDAGAARDQPDLLSDVALMAAANWGSRSSNANAP